MWIKKLNEKWCKEGFVLRNATFKATKGEKYRQRGMARRTKGRAGKRRVVE